MLSLFFALSSACSTALLMAPTWERFPTEGGGSVLVCGTVLAQGTALRAQILPAGGSDVQYGGVAALVPPVRYNATCLNVSVTAAASTPLHEGAGMLVASSNNGTTWTSPGERAQLFDLVSVAFGRRPYLNEPHAELLVRTDPAMMARLSPGSHVQVNLSFPFAATGQQTRTFTTATEPLLLRAAEIRLPFSFVGLPTIVNQDVVITITVDGTWNITKYRRFMRAPPPASPSVLAVQVDHTTKSLLVDGRVWSGQGWYIAHEDMPMNGFTSAIDMLVRDAQRSLNTGVLYGIYSWSAKEQLAMLDQLASVGYRGLYDLGIGSRGGGRGSGANKSAIKESVNIVKDHPAILGYYICDDCCGMGQSKASSLAQIYNFIWALDPYHITTGAVNCGTSWTWSDVPSLDAPTTNLSDAAIAEGQQPLLQLSIDYILHENYGRAFSDHECDGFWAHCLGGDGELRKGVPFEPVVNCLGRNSYGTERSGGAAEEKFSSLAYLGVVEAGMIDQVTFADPIRSENTAAAKIAQEFLELRPSLQGEFGKHYPLTATVEAFNGSCQGSGEATSDLRAKIWQEESESGLCAHLVVINLDAYAPAQFQVTLIGLNSSALAVKPACNSEMSAARLNCDATGTQMASLPTDNATGCAAACCANPSCSGYVWNPTPKGAGVCRGSESGPCCYLKRGTSHVMAPAAFSAGYVAATRIHTDASSIAVRMWALGANLNIDAQGRLDPGWIGPGGHNIYRIGCSSPPPTPGNIIPSWESSRDFSNDVIKDDLYAGQSAETVGFQANPNGYARDDYATGVNPLSNVVMQADTTVRLPTARHSIRISVPTGAPYVFALPGPGVAKRVQKRPEDSKCCLSDPAVNCDLTGGSLNQGIPTKDAVACAAACCAHGANCTGYGWVPSPKTPCPGAGNATGRPCCYLKTGASHVLAPAGFSTGYVAGVRVPCDCPAPGATKGLCPGDIISDGSVTLPRSSSWLVSLFVQTSPAGTRVEIVDGGWNLTSVQFRGWMPDQVLGAYIGNPIAAVVGNASVEPVSGKRVWQQLEARLPATSSPTDVAALQLRITPPSSAGSRFGATIWVANFSVFNVTQA